MAGKDKGTVDFTGISNPEYAERIAAVKQKMQKPPQPPLPRFDQVSDGRGAPAVSSSVAAERVLTPEQRDRLQSQGSFIPGVGSAYAKNQPGLPRDEEEKPTGEFVNPPRPPGSGLRPETVQQIKEVMDAQPQTPNDASASKVDAGKVKLDEDIKEIADNLGDIDTQFETDEYGRRMRSLTANKERRDSIEKRCEPMAIEDLILQGEVRQRVPIVPGKLEAVFRSVSGNEDLFIKRLMSSERGSEQYIMDRFSLLNLAVGLYALNSKVLPNHLDAQQNPDKDLFEIKLKAVSRLPLVLLSDLSVNYIWFNRRVQKLLVFENLKNF